MLDFSVIIPVYNEERAIGAVLDRLEKVLDGVYEVIVVDDGSSDNTRAVVEQFGGPVRVLSHPYNIGNGAAVKTGIRNAKGRYLVMMDGDGQHAPEDVPRLLALLKTFDMVVGARTEESEGRLHRNFANRVYNLLASYVTDSRVMDLTSGFRAIRTDIVKKYVYLLPNQFSYPTTITLCLMKAGFGVKYMPIKAAKRTGKSKIKLLSDGTRFFLIILRIATLFSPFRIFLPVSVLLFFMGVGNYVYTFLKYRTFTNMSMLMFTTAIIVFMMGLVAEQIAQLRLEGTEDR